MFFLCGVVRLGEVLVRTSGIFLAVDISSVPFLSSSCLKSLRACGLL